MKSVAASITTLSGLGVAAGSSTAAGRTDPERSIERAHGPVGVYDYGREGGGWERKSPINVIVRGLDAAGFVDRMATDYARWNPFRNTAWERLGQLPLDEKRRYCWDADRGQMVGPGRRERRYQSLGWAPFHTGDYGVAGRYHARCWELAEGVLSVQAHREDAALLDGDGHRVTSYTEARRVVVTQLTRADDLETDGTYDFDGQQAQPGDHDGTAAIVRASR